MFVKLLLISLFAFIPFYCKGQTSTDSVNVVEGYKKWSKSKPAIRLGFGVQKSIFTEVGISRHRFFFNGKDSIGSFYIAALEFFPTTNNEKTNIYGIKLASEIYGKILTGGMEYKFLIDRENKVFVIAPKIGIGYYSFINLFYCYNFAIFSTQFERVGNHQLSLNLNLNQHLLSRIKRK